MSRWEENTPHKAVVVKASYSHLEATTAYLEDITSHISMSEHIR